MRRLAYSAAALGIVAATGGLAPVASAIPFGADLNRPANNTIGCETGGIIANPLAPGQLILLPSGQTSCTWTANGRLGDFAETLAVPATGTVTQVQVKVGPVTGPMRVVSYSALNKFPIPLNQPPACCQIRGQSQVFTPGPNGVTTVNVNLPVVTEKVPPPPGDILRADSIGLSVLTPNVPVPAHNTGVYDALQGAPVDGVYVPQAVAGQERLAPAGLVGFQVLLRAELTPAGAGAGGGAGNAGNSGSSGSAKCGGRKPTMTGTNRRETLRGTPKRDIIAGRGGNDRIIGRGGNDLLCGGAGKDVILGGAGNDVILGGNQNDRLFGNAGRDKLLGGRGRDLLAGGGGRDNLDGGPGAGDRNRGGGSKDRCRRGRAVAC